MEARQSTKQHRRRQLLPVPGCGTVYRLPVFGGKQDGHLPIPVYRNVEVNGSATDLAIFNIALLGN